MRKETERTSFLHLLVPDASILLTSAPPQEEASCPMHTTEKKQNLDLGSELAEEKVHLLHGLPVPIKNKIQLETRIILIIGNLSTVDGWLLPLVLEVSLQLFYTFSSPLITYHVTLRETCVHRRTGNGMYFLDRLPTKAL